jgi:hypothetical protein
MAAFTWGPGGSQMTPEQIASQRAVSQALMQQGMDYSPVKHWSQGAARVTQALLGGYEGYRADEAEKTNRAAEAQLLASLPGMGGAATTAAPAAPAAVAAPALPAAPADPAIAPPVVAPSTAPALTSSIAKVAAARGVDPAYLTRTAMLESGGNVNAANPNSSARGPFQFLKGTAQQYGLTNPNDPEAATDAAARLALDNKATLTKALGREPTSGELYLAHQQGGTGASKLLANPNLPVEVVIGPEAARLNGAKPGMTAGEFAAKWTNKYAGASAAATGAMAEASAPAAAPARAPASGLAGVDPRHLQALASPYTSEGTKKILTLMLQHQMSQQGVSHVDAGNAIIVLDKQGNEIRRLPKGEPNKGPEFGVIGKDEFGNEQYGWRDPRDKSTTPVRPTAATPAGPITVTGPDGKQIPVPPGQDPKKFREHVTTATADAAVGKKTEVQAKDEKFANKMELAERNIGTGLEGEGTKGGERTAESIPLVGNYLHTENYQKYKQARDNFITALLRDESGAAIGTAEFNRYERELFPQPGDGPGVIEQKREARRIAIEGMKKGAGPGYKSPTEAPAPAAPAATGKTKAGVTWSVK